MGKELFGTDAPFLNPYGAVQPLNGFWSPSTTEVALSIAGVKVASFKSTANALSPSPRCAHTGGTPVKASTDGTNATPVITETYIAEIQLPTSLVTGIAVFNGTVASGNIKVILYDKSGVVVASSASTAMAGTDAFQRVPFSATYKAQGGTYYVGLQVDNVTARNNMHPIGNFGAGKKTGETYGVATTITPPTTFTADLGPMASAY